MSPRARLPYCVSPPVFFGHRNSAVGPSPVGLCLLLRACRLSSSSSPHGDPALTVVPGNLDTLRAQALAAGDVRCASLPVGIRDGPSPAENRDPMLSLLRRDERKPHGLCFTKNAEALLISRAPPGGCALLCGAAPTPRVRRSSVRCAPRAIGLRPA